jgi:hypothetical protein
MFDAAGGPEKMLEDYAVLALSDHGTHPLLPNRRRFVRLGRILGEGASADLGKLRAGVGDRGGSQRPLGPPILRGGREREKVVTNVLSRRGVDLAAWSEDGWGVVRRLGGSSGSVQSIPSVTGRGTPLGEPGNSPAICAL